MHFLSAKILYRHNPCNIHERILEYWTEKKLFTTHPFFFFQNVASYFSSTNWIYMWADLRSGIYWRVKRNGTWNGCRKVYSRVEILISIFITDRQVCWATWFILMTLLMARNTDNFSTFTTTSVGQTNSISKIKLESLHNVRMVPRPWFTQRIK